MKTLIKRIFILLFSIVSIAQYAQNTTKTVETNISFGHAPDCRGNQGACTFTDTSKTKSNTQVQYNAKTGELIFEIIKYKTSLENQNKIKANKLQKGYYLYNFDTDFILPTELLSQLNIKGKTKIKKGNYLVIDKGKTYLLTVQLN